MAFGTGQTVCLRADPARRGAVIEQLSPIAGELRYRVFHAPDDIQEYYASQLIADTRSATQDDLASALGAGRLIEAQEFRARLTAARLSHPLIDNLYAMYAARIQHIPFQYKPLLRILRSDRPRLLIADEVGVGKTIEAGLILKEMQSRQRLDSVLIVCPKALVAKWRAEMLRFDENFEILTADQLRYCLDETHRDGVWPTQHGRAIVHLELLRRDEYLLDTNGKRRKRGLLQLDPPPQFDYLIVDEAHHIRNPETRSYAAVQYLSAQSEGAVFLSATPVHVGSRNLFTLLNLLRPDVFLDEAVFAAMVEPNSHLTTAMRHVRNRRPVDSWQADAAAALKEAAETVWGQQALRQDPRFAEWHDGLDQPHSISDSERVRCVRDLEEVHTLARIMNRTRRRDIDRFTIREPNAVIVEFTHEQQEFYKALLEFRREVLSLRYNPLIVRLIMDTLERQAASCLPALVPTLDRFIRTGRFAVSEVTDDPELEEESTTELPPALVEQARELRTLAAALPNEDPKRDQLLMIVRDSMAAKGPGKVLVFSFFLHTLAYLQGTLEGDGLRVATVSGQVPDEVREQLRDRFRLPRDHPRAIDVLLSSEVGCEGLDYEFCDRLINYDIPWNPMRIEQRIGRIDRFGQRAEKVLIFNFITPGTVEERIFFRCFDRLGIFRDTVGDLEEVLGDLVPELTRIALDPSLTPDQAEEKAQQMADNAIRHAQEQERLEEESGGLLGLDQAFMDEFEAVQAEGRFVSADDLKAMVSLYLAEPDIDGRLLVDEQHPGLNRIRLRKEGRARLLHDVRSAGQLDRPGPAMSELQRWLNGDDPNFIVTFDQPTATARRDVPFMTPVHPLAKVAAEHWRAKDDPLVAALSVKSRDTRPGRYLFVCDLWETIAIKPELRLVVAAWDLDRDELAVDVGDRLLGLLRSAENSNRAQEIGGSSLNDGVRQVEEHAYRLREEALGILWDQNKTLVAQKLASLDASYRNRLQRVESEVATAAHERIRIMKLSEKGSIERNYQEERAKIDRRRAADITTRRLASGVIEVTHGV